MHHRAVGAGHFERLGETERALEPRQRGAAIAVVQADEDRRLPFAARHLVGAETPEVAFEIAH